MIRCLIVDDELIARKGIERYAGEIPFLSVAGSLRTAIEAMDFLNANEIDVLVLDIQMPQLSGLDFLKTLHHPPLTIIITAYPDYALQGFDLDVIDYIVKPASFDRFLKACNKAKEYLELKQNQKSNTGVKNYFFVKANGRIEKILFDDILLIEAKENYSTIYTLTSKHLVLLSLKNIEASLDNEKFMRVHKSFIVSINKIKGIEGHTIFIDKHKVSLSRDAKPILIAAWTKNEMMRR
jgi:two-component system LytT family response regulator